MALTAKRIAVVDSDQAFVENVLSFVSNRYDFEITSSKEAEYVFHSVHGYDVLKYSGVRIFLAGENVSPNFSISDYAMTFERMTFGDRYIWLPLIKLYRESYASLCLPRPPLEQVLAQKTEFCAYVMSNLRDSAEERIRIFELLSDYKKVNSGGRWGNNVGGPVRDKISFQSKHKFVIAFENCSHPGYITEKFAEAAASNAIPIYWGDPGIASLFNPKAFVNCHDFDSFDQVVKRVREIDNNDLEYRQMLKAPWFHDNKEPDCLKNEVFSDFLTNIFDQRHQSAYRRNRGRWGIKKERQLHEMWDKPYLHLIKMVRRHWLTYFHRIVPKKTRR